MAKRQVVLMKAQRPGPRASGEAPTLAPLGTADEVIAALAAFNTAPDGAPTAGNSGTVSLHGPGMVLMMPTTQDEVTQLVASLTEEEMALPVLMRACKALGWAMMDMETGRTFGG